MKLETEYVMEGFMITNNILRTILISKLAFPDIQVRISWGNKAVVAVLFIYRA